MAFHSRVSECWQPAAKAEKAQGEVGMQDRTQFQRFRMDSVFSLL
tara:strand:+ start:9238 stop:9372 length:135 start_codon:yes stop_codon:yes gene_type:complete